MRVRIAHTGEAVKEKAEQVKERAEQVKEKMRHPLVNKLIVLFIILFTLWELLLYLHGTNYITIPDVFLASSRSIIIVLAVLAITSIVVRLTSDRIFKLFEGEVDIEYRIFLAKLYAFSVYVFGILIILYVLGLSLTDLTLGLTLLATGVAFAIREVLLSYFVWAILLTKKPFRLGDIIAFGDDVGTVKRIGTFYVTLNMTDGSLVKLPNKLFLEKNFVVHGEKFNEFILLRISKPPKDAADGFKTMRAALKSITGEDPSINLRTNVDSLHLLIEYPVTIESRFRTRSAVLTKISEVYGDVVAYRA
jgi:small-conductance mechanosensitive channel